MLRNEPIQTSPRQPLSVLGDVFFYILIALAGFSPPLLEFGGDFLTWFDLYLVGYIAVKLVTTGFALDRAHWSTLLVVFGVYLVYLTVGALRVFTPYALLLLLKHFEHVGFLLVLLDRFGRTSHLGRDLIAALTILLLVVVYQLLYYYGVLPGIGHTYRLGLPFMLGVSSNPSGFFLGGTLIVLLHVGFTNRALRVVSLPLAACALWALALTLSRTNGLAFLFVVALSFVVWIWQSRYRWPLLIGFLGIGLFLYLVVVPLIPAEGVLSRVVRILQDPAQIFQENSFRIRHEELWVKGFQTWLRSGWTFLFGAGLGYHERIDGTIPRLLGGQGVIGLLAFAYVWYAHYVRRERSPAAILLLVFTLINGINAETLVVSYRSVQLYLVLLMIAVYGSRLLDQRADDPARESPQARLRAPGIVALLTRRWLALTVPLIVAGVVSFMAEMPPDTPLAGHPIRLGILLAAGLVVGLIAAFLVDYFVSRTTSEKR